MAFFSFKIWKKVALSWLEKKLKLKPLKTIKDRYRPLKQSYGRGPANFFRGPGKGYKFTALLLYYSTPKCLLASYWSCHPSFLCFAWLFLFLSQCAPFPLVTLLLPFILINVLVSTVFHKIPAIACKTIRITKEARLFFELFTKVTK